ncbi:MAG: YbaB/EbfC family nucleoid-associated protein [Firmicutes bacterium]|nr:YbaB/EbfC family nucleoid-associated protein [Bacillota bacterium]
MAKGGFRGGMMPGGQANMMRQAQKMQQDILKMQEELETKEFFAAAGGGAVTATANGKRELVSVVIAPEAVDPEDVEMLQDLIVAAANEALRKAEEAVSANMQKFTGGLNLGGLGF